MLSVILPVKNEPYLPQLLTELNHVLKQPYEVKVQTEKGLGYAVMCGIKQSKGETICVMDSDGSHPPKFIPPMLNLIGKYDVVVGSRYAGGKTEDSLIRQIVSRAYCSLGQILFGLRVKDCMSGFIIAKKEVFVNYPINCEGFKFLLDILVRSKKIYNIIEYPIVFERRKMGKSKANPTEAIRTFAFMLKLYACSKGKS